MEAYARSVHQVDAPRLQLLWILSLRVSRRIQPSLPPELSKRWQSPPQAQLDNLTAHPPIANRVPPPSYLQDSNLPRQRRWRDSLCQSGTLWQTYSCGLHTLRPATPLPVSAARRFKQRSGTRSLFLCFLPCRHDTTYSHGCKRDGAGRTLLPKPAKHRSLETASTLPFAHGDRDELGKEHRRLKQVSRKFWTSLKQCKQREASQYSLRFLQQGDWLIPALDVAPPPGFLSKCLELRLDGHSSPQAHSAQHRSRLRDLRPHSRSQIIICCQLALAGKALCR